MKYAHKFKVFEIIFKKSYFCTHFLKRSTSKRKLNISIYAMKKKNDKLIQKYFKFRINNDHFNFITIPIHYI